MRKKKGVSPLIAVVLLVAFSVAMAAFVSTYVINKTKKVNFESFAEDTVLCDSVTLAYDTLKDETTGENKLKVIPVSGINNLFLITGLKLKNKGSFTIYKLTITAPGQPSQEYGILGGIKPSGSKDNTGKSIDYFDELGNQDDRGIAFTYNNDINLFKKNPNIKITPWIRNPDKKDGDPEQNVICTKKVLYINPIELCNTIATSVGRTLQPADETGEITRRCKNIQWSTETSQ
ncbi:MAG: archaellin/type IV pilin N-terminal domain-containing protein [Nanoarchaeota archaeon]